MAGERAMPDRVIRENLCSLAFWNGYCGYGDRPPADLDADIGCMEDVLVPGRGRPPPGGNDKTVIGRIMPDHFQNRLTLLSGNPATVIQ